MPHINHNSVTSFYWFISGSIHIMILGLKSVKIFAREEALRGISNWKLMALVPQVIWKLMEQTCYLQSLGVQQRDKPCFWLHLLA